MSESSAVGASWPTTFAAVPRRAASCVASQRIEIVSGPVTLIGVVGVVQWARQRSTCALASPCQMTLTWPIVTSTGSPRMTFDGDVEEHAVAHVDRVVEADDPARRAVLRREVLEHALAAEARLRVLADRRRRRRFAGAGLADAARRP